MAHLYKNIDPSHRPHTMRAVFRWGVWERALRKRRVDSPGPPAPRTAPDLTLIHGDHLRPSVTWIGHASFLGRLGGASFLIDPVFSRRVGWVVRRHGAPGLRITDLPPIEALMITHCHYDHLDRPSVRALPRTTAVFVPLGLGRWFRRLGFDRVTEMDWWQSAAAGSLTITFVPACHWSRRGVFDTNRTLWGGYVVEGGGHRVYHCGDSAFFDGFSEIGRRFPGIAAALLPVGSYAPAWFMEHNHMSPEQAGRAFLDLEARRFVPMHWGAFKLTDESLCEPPARLERWWDTERPDDGGRRLTVPKVGQTVALDE